MKNSLYNLFVSKLNIKIIGSNTERIIKRLKNNKIDILYLKYIDDGIKIKIYKKDYEKLISIKTTYDIEVIGYSGFIGFKNGLLNSKYVLISILICFIFLYFLTNLIFNIEVVTNDTNMKEKILNELAKNGIKKYKLKKDYKKLQLIKSNIISKYRNEIQWIEIEVIGTKYIVKYEPRIQNKIEEESNYRNIVAKSDSVIKEMYVSSGQIVKSKNTYVKKGDVIVSGYIYLNGNIKDTVSSKGTIYGECWYNVTVNYPFKYYEEKTTGNSKNIFVIEFINNKIELFNFNKYTSKRIKNKVLLKNNILPIKLIYQKQEELNIINENNNEKMAIEKAIKYSKDKLEETLDSDEYISEYKILNKEKYSDKVVLNIFFSVIKNITEYEEIPEYKEETID